MPCTPIDRAAVRWDVILYAGFAAFVAGYGATTALVTHERWGRVAVVGYLGAGALALAQVALARVGARGRWAAALAGPAARAALAGLAFLATAVVPMLLLVVGRAAGRSGTAQEEVRVTEGAGSRLLAGGTPYLDREAIATLPAADRLEAYTPYQPGMALFGTPRALDPGAAWWSDVRVWFAAAAVAALACALVIVRDAPAGTRVRAVQAATVAPTVALPVAVGGDDVPVLALCLLALALVARSRPGAAGLAIGVAGALKLVAWPVAVVLAVHAVTRGRATMVRFGAGALGVPALVLLPVLLTSPGAVAENTVAFPLGHGLVASPAGSPLPGQLLAAHMPGGRAVAIGLLLATAVALGAWLTRRPPRTAAAVAAVSGWGLLAAMLLMPATRYGYLLYPVALLAWVPALRPVETTVPPSGVPPAVVAGDAVAATRIPRARSRNLDELSGGPDATGGRSADPTGGRSAEPTGAS